MNGQHPKHPLRIIIAAGGTGGHLFPGIAVAQEFMSRNRQNQILFVITGRPFEIKVLAKVGFQHQCISSEALKGRGLWNQIKASIKILKGIYESVRILKDFKPRIAVGVGSYTSGPLIIAAWLMGIKIVLQEQNILPGITNRLLAPFADRIYISFENTKIGASWRPAGRMQKKIRFTGNPIRQEFYRSTDAKNKNNIIDSEEFKAFTVLIIGGSQGAHSINMAVMEAAHHIKKKELFAFIHQTGPKDESEAQKTYTHQGIDATVKSFFVDMASLYRKADLVICRAGATTMAEVTAMGKGIIFIPYPFAADNHQVLNARALANVGGAEMILQKDLNGKILAERIEYYASNANALGLMASKAKNFGRPDAATAIVDDCYELTCNEC
jgi:UDP-N-acetylglucosamine--N-acetylmuramyl-(pentapeptide) pyrophosphoryl-undecaprenol N-acetylglucosamine transferase